MPDEIEYLYKYRSLSERSVPFVERTLLHNELYFPRPAEFNDPFDCCPAPSSSVTAEEWEEYLNRLYKERAPHLSAGEQRREVAEKLKDPTLLVCAMTKSANEIANSVGVLSLSARPDHPLMWSHYSDSHRGICLRFRASSEMPFFGRAQKVRYQAKRPQLNPIRDSRHLGAEKALLTKADFWSYEEEWRIIEYEAGPGIQTFPPEQLDGIILGTRMSAEDSNRVRGWISERSQQGIELLQARTDESEFRIGIFNLE
jgi:hypothetical protein